MSLEFEHGSWGSSCLHNWSVLLAVKMQKKVWCVVQQSLATIVPCTRHLTPAYKYHTHTMATCHKTQLKKSHPGLELQTIHRFSQSRRRPLLQAKRALT